MDRNKQKISAQDLIYIIITHIFGTFGTTFKVRFPLYLLAYLLFFR